MLSNYFSRTFIISFYYCTPYSTPLLVMTCLSQPPKARRVADIYCLTHTLLVLHTTHLATSLYHTIFFPSTRATKGRCQPKPKQDGRTCSVVRQMTGCHPIKPLPRMFKCTITMKYCQKKKGKKKEGEKKRKEESN